MMLLEDEALVVRWLSQYGALPKIQLARLLGKGEERARRIFRNLWRQGLAAEVCGGSCLGPDAMSVPDARTVQAVWVLLKFMEAAPSVAHYPASYPSQLFFLRGNIGYEVTVLYEGEGHLLRLLRPEEDLKYILVLPHDRMIAELRPPPAPHLFATVFYAGRCEPEVTFYSEEAEHGTHR